jgi:hypothetical protein
MIKFERPLQWLPQQPRTKRPERAIFGNHSPSKAGDELISELGRLGAKQCVISSNLEERKRGGGFYANQRVDDSGVVVYFQLKGKSKAMACDKWDRPEHNLWALFLSVQAIRGLERWGGSEFLDGLFEGFKALPSPDSIVETAPQWFADCTGESDTKKLYRHLVKELHPDVGGEPNEFAEMKRQYDIEMSKY